MYKRLFSKQSLFAAVSLGTVYTGQTFFSKNILAQEAENSEVLIRSSFEKSKYVIVGGGVAAAMAVRGIRENDTKGKITMISDEKEKPYKRPLLRHIFAEGGEMSFSDLEDSNVEQVHSTVVSVDFNRQAVLLENDTVISWKKLCLATGTELKEKPQITDTELDLDKVSEMYSIGDMENLKEVAKTKKDITVIGDGLLATELSENLSKKDVKVTQILKNEGVLSNFLPDHLSQFLTEKLTKEYGVKFIKNTRATSVDEGEDDNVKIGLSSGDYILTDHAIVTGSKPASDLVKNDLEIDERGCVVANQQLQAYSNVYVAGDILSFYDHKLKTRRSFPHFDNAAKSGYFAGLNMSNKKQEKYSYQPHWFTDIGDIHLEGIGLISNDLETVSVFKQPKTTEETPNYKRGVVYYVKDNMIVGFVLWNVDTRQREFVKKMVGIGYDTETVTQVVELIPPGIFEVNREAEEEQETEKDTNEDNITQQKQQGEQKNKSTQPEQTETPDIKE